MGRGRLAASHGMQQAISTPAPPTYLKLDWTGHQALMREMGQTGTEGQGYVNTSQSFIVNRFLRNGGNIIDAHKATSNWSWLTRSDIQATIRRMDSQMRPLSRDIQAVRYTGPGILQELGLPAQATAATARTLQRRIQHSRSFDYTPKAYTSVSTDNSANVFTGMPVKINYKIGKGTPCIVTANMPESEVVLGRGVKHKLTGARWVNGKLEIDVTV